MAAALPIPIDAPKPTDDVVVVGFNYDGLPQGLTADLRKGAERIRELSRLQAKNIVEAGEIFIRIKDKELDHGQFVAWVEAECGISVRTAQRFMLAAKMMAGQHDIVSCLDATSLQLLTAPSTPSEIRSEIFDRCKAGERVRPAQVKEAIDKAKGEAAAKKRETEEAAVKPSTRKARQKREEERRREQQEYEEKRSAALAAGEFAAMVILARLEPEDRKNLIELFGARSYDHTTSHYFARGIVDALFAGLKAEPVEAVAVVPAATPIEPVAARGSMNCGARNGVCHYGACKGGVCIATGGQIPGNAEAA